MIVKLDSLGNKRVFAVHEDGTRELLFEGTISEWLQWEGPPR